MKQIFTLLFTIFSISFFGQIEIEKVIVDVAKNGLTQRESGRNILVFTKEEIDQLSVHSVDDLIRYLPGIEVQSRGGFGVQGDITMRGSTFNQVLILIDGARLYDPLTGHFNSYIPIAIGEIERVEIIKGAASSIYGPDAVGGVINFITKINSSSDEVIESEIKTGSYNFIGNETAVYQKNSKINYSLGIQRNQSDGQEYANPNRISVEDAPLTYRNMFDNQTYSIAVGRNTQSAWRYFFRSSFDQRSFGAKYFYTNSVYDESVENIKVWFNHFHLSKTSEKSNTKIDLTHRYGEDEFIFNPNFPKNFNRSQFYQAQVHHTYYLNAYLNLGIGAQADYRLTYSIDRGDRSNYHGGAYTTFNFHKESLFVNGSIRADYDQNYELVFSPSLSMAYHKNSFTYRAAISKGIRAADFTERYVSTNLTSLSSGRNLGNPDLEEEKSWNIEFGTDYQLSERSTLSGTVFTRRSENLIDYVATMGSDINTEVVALDSAGIYFYSQNLSDLETYGFEAEVKRIVEINEKHSLSVFSGYTYLDSKTVEGELSKYISNHSKHLLNGSMDYRYENLNLFISALWKYRKTAFNDLLILGVKRDYLLVNAGAQIDLADDKIGIRLEINNLGDVQAQDIYGAILPGRWLLGSLKIKL